MRYNFKSSLKQGQAGEAKFHKLFPHWTRTDGKKEDFVTPAGAKIELKTERRTTEETPNLALEVTSSAGRPGAIERAVDDCIDYIIYYFADEKYFVYRPQQLLLFMGTSMEKLRIVKIQNSTYTSTVMLVPRDAIKHLEVNIIDESDAK